MGRERRHHAGTISQQRAAELQNAGASPGGEQMGLESKELYRNARGDRWLLVREPGSEHVFIRHVPNLASGGQAEHIEVGAFLKAQGLRPEHQELLRLIGTLVEH
jgi:hypothetical protein